MASDSLLTQLKELDIAELEFNSIGVWPLPVRIIVLVVVFVLVCHLL